LLFRRVTQSAAEKLHAQDALSTDFRCGKRTRDERYPRAVIGRACAHARV
jgi:hypothetical protein